MNIINKVGKRFMSVSYHLIKDEFVAERVASHLARSQHDSIILPFSEPSNPIVKAILERDFATLVVSEPDDETRESFEDHIRKTHSHKNIHIYHHDLIDLMHKNRFNHAQDKCDAIIDQCSTNSDDCDRKVKFLVPLLKARNESGLLRNIYFQMCFRVGLCSKLLMNYYFLMSGRQYSHIDPTSKNMTSHFNITYNTIFKIHKLETFELKSAFGIGLRQIQNTRAKKPRYEEAHLVSLEPRGEVIDRIDPKVLIEFRFFVAQIMCKRFDPVVCFLERWFRVDNEDLRNVGIASETQIINLERSKFFEIFMYFRNRPDYSQSAFPEVAKKAEGSF